MLMSAEAYRESLRRLRPTVYVDGERIGVVADAPQLAPGRGCCRQDLRTGPCDDLAPVMQARCPASTRR
jgi:4-hydroxybutyryl-CoA dehydratase / vinylacetyl-CoA-Delta-isomerase